MKYIPNAVSKKVAMALLKTQKNSPTLLFGAGVTGVIGTVVLASKATLKIEETLEDTNAKLEMINSVETNERYSDMDRQRDKAIVYTNAVVNLTKLYAPAIALGVFSIGCFASSHRILTRRNAALAAAYSALDKGFREYRERVIKDVGEEKDLEYRYGLEKDKVEVTDENGKKSKVEKTFATARSPYGVLFREGNANWQTEPDYNIMFLRGVQNWANDKLRANGYLLLNDVYDELRVEKTKAGMVVGWLENGDGDGYVDFGILNPENASQLYDYVTGREGEIFIDFNVDGNIYDKF